MTVNDAIGIALSLSVAVFAGCALTATMYFGGLAVYETLVDIWRWAKAHLEFQRQLRDEELEEWARRVAR